MEYIALKEISDNLQSKLDIMSTQIKSIADRPTSANFVPSSDLRSQPSPLNSQADQCPSSTEEQATQVEKTTLKDELRVRRREQDC